MAGADETRTLVEIAHLYYDENLTQESIAKKYNMSRSLVSKMITKARKLGIVEIVIHDESINSFRGLEADLKKAFGLSDVACVSLEFSKMPFRTLGIAGGKFLARKMQKAKLITITGGRTNYELAINFPTSPPFSNAMFVPMSGGLGTEAVQTQANMICETLAQRSGGQALQLHAPVAVDSSDVKRMLMRQPFIKEVLDASRKADIAVVGIGKEPKYTEWGRLFLPKEKISNPAIDRAFAGDLAYNLFNSRGESLDCAWHDHKVSLDLEEIIRIPEVIAIAGGENKAKSVYIAAKYGLFNSLVTDTDTAKQMLSMHK